MRREIPLRLRKKLLLKMRKKLLLMMTKSLGRTILMKNTLKRSCLMLKKEEPAMSKRTVLSLRMGLISNSLVIKIYWIILC